MRPGSGGVVSGAGLRVARALESLHAGLDELLASIAELSAPADTLGDSDTGGGTGGGAGVPMDLVRALDEETFRARNRLDSARLRLGAVARTEREAGRGRHLDEAQFFASGGRMDGPSAAKDADLAEGLGNATPAPTTTTGPESPQGSAGTRAGGSGDPANPEGVDGGAGPGRSPVGVALDQGWISKEHALVIHQALAKAPDWVTAQQRHTIEVHLVNRARTLRPSSLRRAARRLLEALPVPVDVVDEHENALITAEEDHAYANASFTVHHTGRGISYGKFALPTLQAKALEKTLASLSSPTRRKNQHHTSAGDDDASGTGTGAGACTTSTTGTAGVNFEAGEVAKDWATLKGQALAELIDHLPTDRLGTRTSYTVIVSTDLDTLRGETNRAGTTDTGQKLSAGQVRRLAAQSGIIPTVMGGESLPLDLGTQRRFFTETQRMALAHLYSECAVEDCDRPFAWCQLHHATPWASTRGTPPGWAPPEPPPHSTGHPDGHTEHCGGAAEHPGDPGHPDDTGQPDAPGPLGQTTAASRGARGRTDLSNAIPVCGRHNRIIELPGVTHHITHDHAGAATIHIHD
ncbi:DUF222 domain-containing protein [Kytococcus sedentarius]|uniref:DUF222 domain-containing protein n=1 Tax=Kytococcus sedentarius TaxID=1276 RepID=UPI0035BBE2D2